MSLVRLLILLFAGHALCDYPLQGDYLAKSKNQKLCGDSAGLQLHLFYHAMIQGAMVLLVTSSSVLAIAEILIHGITDWAKCEGKITGRVDQAIHIGCKLAWALIAWRFQWRGI